jgi:hypothetical protein
MKLTDKLADLYFEMIHLREAIKSRNTVMKHVGDLKILKKLDKLNRKQLQKLFCVKKRMHIINRLIDLQAWWEKNGLIIQYFAIGFALSAAATFTICNFIK